MSGLYTDAHTGKPVAGTIVYDDDGQSRYRITCERGNDIENVRFIDLIKGTERFFARLAGFDGAYIRFTGKVSIERFESGKIVETMTRDSAVWELMYLGYVPKVREK